MMGNQVPISEAGQILKNHSKVDSQVMMLVR